MNIHNLKLLVSAVSKKQYPGDLSPEIALAGRSNVGKSSFTNKMLNRKSLARVSSSPGKTATINFYGFARLRLCENLERGAYALGKDD